MQRSRRTKSCPGVPFGLRSGVAAATVGAGGAPIRPCAQGRLDARYAVTLAGIPIGKGAWVIDIAEDQYTAAASGATAGLLRVFASGQGSGASRGFIVGGTPVPASFAASITSDKKTEEIRMTLGSRRREGLRDHARRRRPTRIACR